MNAPVRLSEVTPQTVEFKLDNKTIHAFEGETIFKAAQRHGIHIPHLCYKDGYRADGNCRACVVEIKGERTLAPSCCRVPMDGMDVTTDADVHRSGSAGDAIVGHDVGRESFPDPAQVDRDPWFNANA